MSQKELPVIGFDSQREWERWLSSNHQDAAGLWMKIAKKGTGAASVTYQQALEVALCFGWIDGQKAAFDEGYWLQRFTPRSARSKWSRINREKAQALIDQGRMKPAGLLCIQAAREDGRWEAAYDGQRVAGVPEDLSQELERHPQAGAFFKTLDRANRYAILYRVGEAKLPATRARRIKKFVAMLEAGEKLHP